MHGLNTTYTVFLYSLMSHDKNVSSINGAFFKKICNLSYDYFKNMTKDEISSWILKCNSTRPRQLNVFFKL